MRTAAKKATTRKSGAARTSLSPTKATPSPGDSGTVEQETWKSVTKPSAGDKGTGGWSIRGSIKGRRRLHVNNLSNITLSNLNNKKTAYRFQNETDEQRQHWLQRQRQNNAVQNQNESNEEREQRLQVLRQNDAVRRNARGQELHDLQDLLEKYLKRMANCRATFTQATMGSEWDGQIS